MECPRRVGNTPLTHAETVKDAGSSPRMWGILIVVSHRPRGIRFIPTHVGNTGYMANTTMIQAVHPHACGEYASFSFTMFSHCGSSPRMWGILQRRDGRAGKSRFIPTHVGNTSISHGAATGRAVHPHACGEYALDTAIQAISSGSSPRMWGIQLPNTATLWPSRFIPTHVGNTRTHPEHGSHMAVHPHACGEYYCPPSLSHSGDGSSPRMWGIRAASG